jgi:hypothetical protein
MSLRRTKLSWSLAAVIAGTAVLIFLFVHFRHRKPLSLPGAVVVLDGDPRNQLPISGVEVSVSNAFAAASTNSDSSGFFALKLPLGFRRGEKVVLRFRHPDYQPLDLPETIGGDLCVAHLTPIVQKVHRSVTQPETIVANVRVRYSIKQMTIANVGTAVKTFQIENKGNVLCKDQRPCSPDGKWKASTASATMDAGIGNEFRDARASCIAGPCPFTRIDSDDFSKGGQTISVTARDWSETATFLLEADVVRNMVSDVIHISYPVIFGQALNFTLPPSAQGVSIDADLNRETITFPIGPDIFLSWADCDVRVNQDQTKVYRCQLKPGYSF